MQVEDYWSINNKRKSQSILGWKNAYPL